MLKTKTTVIALATAITIVFGLAAIGAAHDGGSHMTGVVSALDAKASTLTLQDGKQSTVIGLTKTTKYVKEKKAASLADVKVGLRVVVHVRQDDKTKKYTADQVEIGVANATAKPAPPAAGAPKK
jgi:hypothetical protein